MTTANPNSRQGVQAEKPSSPSCIQAEKPLQPWGQQGCFRGDCEPHRGGLLVCVAIMALTESILCLLLSTVVFGLMGAGFVSPLLLLEGCYVAIGVGLPAFGLARQDLGKMRRGRMDPRGYPATRGARDTAVLAIFLAVLNAGLILTSWRW